jgi:hypothetical protein
MAIDISGEFAAGLLGFIRTPKDLHGPATARALWLSVSRLKGRDKVRRLSIALAVGLLWPPTAFCLDLAKYTATIKACVAEVHADPYESRGRFDAYYNPQTHMVATFGTVRADFLFSKCMSQHGYPIGEGRK